MSLFSYNRIGVDFAPSDAVRMNPALKLSDVFGSLGAPYRAALQVVPPQPAVHAPQSYCEVTNAACASQAAFMETLLPVPSTNCVGCYGGIGGNAPAAAAYAPAAAAVISNK
jgi:hypothetical protein